MTRAHTHTWHRDNYGRTRPLSLGHTGKNESFRFLFDSGNSFCCRDPFGKTTFRNKKHSLIRKLPSLSLSLSLSFPCSLYHVPTHTPTWLSKQKNSRILFAHARTPPPLSQAPARRAGGAGGGGRAAGGGSSNILQFYTDDSPGLQVGPTTVLVASLSFVGVVVLLHIWGKFRM
mmetsp:Transcript_2986/g.6627  ORF Transcript_2986/g.6627 Transcript_2986/m.6627 type:complete len:174 (+) Transcript_2986:36-557(+)